MGKTPNSNIIHLLGGEYCWIVRDSEPIRLLKSPRSQCVYTKYIYNDKAVQLQSSPWQQCLIVRHTNTCTWFLTYTCTCIRFHSDVHVSLST